MATSPDPDLYHVISASKEWRSSLVSIGSQLKIQLKSIVSVEVHLSPVDIHIHIKESAFIFSHHQSVGFVSRIDHHISVVARMHINCLMSDEIHHEWFSSFIVLRSRLENEVSSQDLWSSRVIYMNSGL